MVSVGTQMSSRERSRSGTWRLPCTDLAYADRSSGIPQMGSAHNRREPAGCDYLRPATHAQGLRKPHSGSTRKSSGRLGGPATTMGFADAGYESVANRRQQLRVEALSRAGSGRLSERPPSTRWLSSPVPRAWELNPASNCRVKWTLEADVILLQRRSFVLRGNRPYIDAPLRTRFVVVTSASFTSKRWLQRVRRTSEGRVYIRPTCRRRQWQGSPPGGHG